MLPLIATIACPEERDLMTQFYDSNLKLLYHEARKYVSVEEDVEDIVYDAFVNIIEKIHVFKALHAKQRTRYGIVTVRNLCFLHLRKEKHFSLVSFDELTNIENSTEENQPEQITGQKLLCEQIYTVMSQLDTEDRLILEQKYILKWTDLEIARGFGVKSASMRMRITRIKRKLFKLLQDHGFQWTDWQV